MGTRTACQCGVAAWQIVETVEIGARQAQRALAVEVQQATVLQLGLAFTAARVAPHAENQQLTRRAGRLRPTAHGRLFRGERPSMALVSVMSAAAATWTMGPGTRPKRCRMPRSLGGRVPRPTVKTSSADCVLCRKAACRPNF